MSLKLLSNQDSVTVSPNYSIEDTEKLKQFDLNPYNDYNTRGSSFPEGITGREAFELFNATLKPINGSEEVWYKVGTNRFYVADSFDPDAPLWSTKLTVDNDPTSRVRVQIVGKTFPFLRRESETKDGGILYLKNQPQGLPLKENVIESNRIVAELDKPEERLEQWKIVLDFQEKSGLLLTILDSGSKSLHNHLRVTVNLPIAKIQYFTRLFAIAVMGDPVMENPHQPVRIPGFTRKEKGKEQLFYETGKEYSESEILVGFKKFFEYKGLTFPDKCPKDWFGELKKLIKKRDFDGLKLALEKGYDQWENERQQENERRENERNENAEKRRVNGWTNEGETLIDAVNRLKESLGSDAFTIDNSWKFSNADHARGCCPFHLKDSGNSGYIYRGDRGWSFHCPTCTTDSPIDPFLYHLSSFGNVITQYPTGKDYVTKAEDFLRVNGATIPEWKPKPQRKHYKFNNLSTQKIEDKKIVPSTFNGIKREIGAIEIVGDRAPYLQGYINILQSFLDVTLCGLGKSHSLQYLENPRGGKIFILCADPANFSVEEVAKKYTRLIPRHNGYYEDNEGKLKKADKNTPKEDIKIEENCPLAPLFGLAKNKGYDTTGSNPICNKCEFKGKCQVTEGMYMHDRRKALEESKYIICHPEAIIPYVLDSANDISKDIAFADEPSMIFNPTYNVQTSRNDSILEADWYRDKLPDEYGKILDDITQTLKPLYDNKGTYGLDNSEVTEVLFTVVIPDGIEVNDIINHLALNQPDIGCLVAEGERFKNNDLVNEYFANEQVKETARNIDKLPSNTLPLLLRALTGDKRIYLRIQYGKLIITESRDEEYSQFLDKFGMVGFFETTTTSERLRLKTGFKKPLEVIYSPDVNHNNQTIHAISMSGIRSINLKDPAVKRINILVETLFNEHGKFSLIGHKKLKKPVEGTCNARSEVIALDGHYGADNIGSNRFEGQENLMFIQLPFSNKGDLMAEYSVLNDGFNEELFKEYYLADMWEKLVQSVFRQRAVRYEDKTFKTFLIYPEKEKDEDVDLTMLEGWGFPIVYRDAFDVEPMSGDENEVTFFLICCAAWELLNQGLKPTLAAIAEFMTVNGHKISLDGVSKAVTRAGYSFREYITKLEKLYWSYKDKYSPSIKNDFCNIFSKVGWEWLSGDTITEPSFSDVPTPKIKRLDLIKEAVIGIHSEGIIPTPKLVIQWLSEKKDYSITQSGISNTLKRKGVEFADLIPSVVVEAEIENTAAVLDITDGQNKTILEGKNQIIDTTTDLLQTPLESRPMFKVGDRVVEIARPREVLTVVEIKDDGWVKCKDDWGTSLYHESDFFPMYESAIAA
jgi:hypothetical protein